jgi:hypothetical protein
MIRLLVDFNNTRDGVVKGALRRLQGDGAQRVDVGDRIFLTDGDEHWSWGRVTRIERGLLFAEIDWSTWTIRAPG